MRWALGGAPVFTSRSYHRITTRAIGEVVGAALEAVGPSPDLVVLTASPGHAGAFEDLAHVIDVALSPRAAVGWVQHDIRGGDPTEAEPFIELLAAGSLGTTLGVHLTTRRSERGLGISGLPASPGFHARTIMLVAPYPAFPLAGFIKALDDRHPGLAPIGLGVRRGPLLVGGVGAPIRVVHQGAVGVLLGHAADVRRIVIHGGSGIGDWWAVTDAAGNRIRRLGGQPAIDRLGHGAPGKVPALLREGLLGVVVAERHEEPEDDDIALVPYRVEGGDLVVTEPVEVGRLVRPYAITTPRLAHGAQLVASGGVAGGIMYFPDGDHRVEGLGDLPRLVELAGSQPVFVATGEVVLGSVGGQPRLLRAAASMLAWGAHS